MSLEIFESQFLNFLRNNEPQCIQCIDSNQKLINEYYKSSEMAAAFVSKLNSVIMELTSYKLVEKALSHPSFNLILREFRNSEILVRACQENKYKKLVEWLLTMKINPEVKDDFGRTALMYAVQHYPLFFAAEKLLKCKSVKFANMTDNEGNTALFYGLQNKEIFNKLLKTKLFDVQHINSYNESLLTYCSRIDKYASIDKILDLPVQADLVNNVGKTAAMYLVENKRYFQLKRLVKKKKIDVNFKNKFGESLVTIFIKSFYYGYTNCPETFYTESNYLAYKNFASTFIVLIDLGCDFNIVIDEDGNTPILFFLLSENYICANYLLQNYKDFINLDHTNKYGVNARILSLFLNHSVIDSLDYEKKRNAKKISNETLASLLNGIKESVDVFSDHNSVSIPRQTRYLPNMNTRLVQQWCLEVLYPFCGAALKRPNHQLTNNNGSYIFPASEKPVSLY